jgi:predicted Fe-Mo cluster-binding NifX family protein
MKIAISSSGKSLVSPLDPRFGRCAYFLIVDPADMLYEAFENQSAAQSGGAGIQAAQFLANKNVSAVITGHVGPNAVQTLTAAGIEVFAEQQGNIEQVVEKYKRGRLKSTIQSTVYSHFGMGSGAASTERVASGKTPAGGRGMRQGGGFGMGRGSGRGMGRGGGMRQGQSGGSGRGMGRGGIRRG